MVPETDLFIQNLGIHEKTVSTDNNTGFTFFGNQLCFHRDCIQMIISAFKEIN